MLFILVAAWAQHKRAPGGQNMAGIPGMQKREIEKTRERRLP